MVTRTTAHRLLMDAAHHLEFPMVREDNGAIYILDDNDMRHNDAAIMMILQLAARVRYEKANNPANQQ